MLTPGRLALLAALLGVAAFVGMMALGERTPGAILLTVPAAAAASLTAVLTVRQPVAAFGILFGLASLSGVVIELRSGGVRLEQPSVIAALITLAVTRGWPPKSAVRAVKPIVACFAVYLGVLTLASALYAPEFLVSARMIIWTAVSMAGGAAVFALLVRSDNGAVDAWLSGIGVAHATVGIVIAAAFFLVGPNGVPGMQTSPGEPPKVAGLAFEANLFASMLGALAPFAIERFRRLPSVMRALPIVIIVVGVGLGVTRGAYLGLAAAIVVYLGVVTFRRRRMVEVLRLVPVIAVAAVLAPSISAISLPIERSSGASAGTPRAAASALPEPSATGAPARTPRPTPTPEPTPAADTLTYRTTRIPTALSDLRESPLIGLGAASYGQRHELSDRPGTRDYIGILALVAIYETGVIGAAALTLGFGFALRLFWRRSDSGPGAAAAYAASIASLLVAYQATNALFFSINWMLLGAGLAVVEARRAPPTDPARA